MTLNTIFNRDDFAEWPLRAVVAFTARCARRVQPLYRPTAEDEVDRHLAAVGDIILIGEEFGAGVDHECPDYEPLHQAEDAVHQSWPLSNMIFASQASVKSALNVYGAIKTALEQDATECAAHGELGAAAASSAIAFFRNEDDAGRHHMHEAVIADFWCLKPIARTATTFPPTCFGPMLSEDEEPSDEGKE